jgi:hypothetical protein
MDRVMNRCRLFELFQNKLLYYNAETVWLHARLLTATLSRDKTAVRLQY